MFLEDLVILVFCLALTVPPLPCWARHGGRATGAQPEKDNLGELTSGNVRILGFFLEIGLFQFKVESPRVLVPRRS